MKILIYSEARIGSTTLSKWLSKELNYELYDEPFNIDMHSDKFTKDILLNKNIICKCYIDQWKYPHTNITSLEEFISFFDKIILLKRENLLEQAESYIMLRNKGKVYKKYYISNAFKLKYKEDIEIAMKDLSKRTKILDDIFGLNVTYEGLFYKKDDINKIKKYLNLTELKYIELLDISNKYREKEQKFL